MVRRYEGHAGNRVTERGGVGMHDLVIRGGTLIDGSGAPRRQGDVAIQGTGSSKWAPFPAAGVGKSTPSTNW